MPAPERVIKTGPDGWIWGALGLALVGGIAAAVVLALADDRGGPSLASETGSVRGIY